MLAIYPKRQSEKGNVLFLILIAVALFAALSYVVTQSTRSGGGSTEKEKNILNSAGMTQYSTTLRTALMRVVLGGVGIEYARFNVPGSFGTSTQAEVFHPNGGGAGYQQAPAELSATGSTMLTWTYNAEFDIPGVGQTDVAGGNDVIAFLPGVSANVCRQVNEELGINVSGCTAGANFPSGVPRVANATTALVNMSMTSGYAFPTTDRPNLVGPAGCTTVFDRQASGCFAENTPSTRFVYYAAILER